MKQTACKQQLFNQPGQQITRQSQETQALQVEFPSFNFAWRAKVNNNTCLVYTKFFALSY